MSAVGQSRFRNVLMAGLPGVGKSTFGKAYAQMSRTEFVELDKYVEKLAGKSIAEIFAQDGEAAFRALEAQCLERLLRRQRCTIALGGGTLSHPESLALARELGCIVFLTAPIAVIVERLWPHKDSRPLVSQCQSKEQLAEALSRLLEERRATYEAADLVLETSYSSVDTLKIELSWLERSLLDRPMSQNADAKDNVEQFNDSPLRRIPLADPSYRSPREQKSNKDVSEKMERILKAQRHKERAEKRDRSDKKDKKTQRPKTDVQGENLPRPRPEGGPRPVERGASADQPPKPVERGVNADQGPRPVERGPRADQGPRPVERGAKADQGPRPVERGSNADQGPRPAERGAKVDQGPRPVERGSNADQSPRPVDKSGPVPRS